MNGLQQDASAPKNSIYVWLLGIAVAAFILGLSVIPGINRLWNLVIVPREEQEKYRQDQKTIDNLNAAAAVRVEVETKLGILPPKPRALAKVIHVNMSLDDWPDQVGQYLRNNNPPLDGIRGTISGDNDLYLWAEISNAKVQWTMKCQQVVNGTATWYETEFPQKLQGGAVPIGLANRTGQSWHEAPGNPAQHSFCLWYLEPKSPLPEGQQSKMPPLGQN